MTYKKLKITPSCTLNRALKMINKGGQKCLIVVDGKDRLKGTLTDGDLRRAILRGGKLSDKIDKIYNPNAIFFVKGQFSNDKARSFFLKRKFDLIPIVNKLDKVVDYLVWEKFFKKQYKKNNPKLKTAVVIMAGGKGTRLEPFTKVLPKPLVPIHDKPIIEHIIEKFINSGVKKFYITLNYKYKILKAYFEELKPNYSLNFIQEKKPLGTAGSLRFLRKKTRFPLLVTNCDTIIKTDYQEILKFHVQNKFDITLVVSAKEYVIPYGTCKIDDNGNLIKIEEKPKYNFLTNTGLYVINSNILKVIPKNKFYNITQLIRDAKKQKSKIGVYPIDEESWIDTGQWVEYQKAIQKL